MKKELNIQQQKQQDHQLFVLKYSMRPAKAHVILQALTEVAITEP